MELNENIVAIENYLNSKPEVLNKLRESRNKVQKEGVRGFQNSATASDISFWIDKKTEEVISHIQDRNFI